MAQFGIPISDITIPSGWTGTYADIDEASANDSDFGWSDDNTTDTYEYLFDDVDPGDGTGDVIVRCRVSRTDGGIPNNNDGSASTLEILLMEGTTVIATVRVDGNVGLWEDVSYTLSGGEVSNITDWSDLRCRLNYDGGGGSPANRRGVAISWSQFETPDYVAPSGIPIKVNILDVWKDGVLMKINILGVWKDVIAIKQNILGVWKDVL